MSSPQLPTRCARSFDDAEIVFAELGSGAPLLLVPDRGRASDYFEDLGGLTRTRTLIRYDARGTGRTPAPDVPAKYAYPSLARDLEALRLAVGVPRIHILGHGAGATVASVYAGHYPERVRGLILVAPEARFFGGHPDADADSTDRSRLAGAHVAAEQLVRLPLSHPSTEVLDLIARSAPATYARWDERERTHAHAHRKQFSPAAWTHFDGGGDRTEPERFLPKLAEIQGPVLVITGRADAIAGTAVGDATAAWFQTAQHIHLADTGRYPWIDAPALFGQTVSDYLKSVGGHADG